MLAFGPGRCLFHYKDIENDPTMFFQLVRAGHVKFIVCSESMTNFFCSSIPIFCTKRDYIAVTQF